MKIQVKKKWAQVLFDCFITCMSIQTTCSGEPVVEMTAQRGCFRCPEDCEYHNKVLSVILNLGLFFNLSANLPYFISMTRPHTSSDEKRRTRLLAWTNTGLKSICRVCHAWNSRLSDTPVCRARKLSWYSGFRNKSRHAGHARLEIQCPVCRAWKLSWYSGFRNKISMPGMPDLILAKIGMPGVKAGDFRGARSLAPRLLSCVLCLCTLIYDIRGMPISTSCRLQR